MPVLIYIFVTLFLFSSANASTMPTDRLSDCFERLKKKYPPLKSSSYPEGMPQPTEEDIVAIEKTISGDFRFRDDLRRFLLEVSHLNYKGSEPSRPHGGDASVLCNLITANYNMSKPDLIPFWDDGGGYYCIHHETGNILFFPISADLYEPDDYGDLVAFLTFKHHLSSGT